MGKRECAVESLGIIHKNFWQGKKVLVTGHTGFKGTWLVKMLKLLGAEVVGYALPSPTTEGEKFFFAVALNDICSITGDIRDYEYLQTVFVKHKPEIVLHLAAHMVQYR